MGLLMDLLRRGATRGEFERFIEEHADALLRSAFLMTCDLPEAEDLTQECLLRLAKHWPRVRSLEHRHAYARRILINLVVRGAKRRARRRLELFGDGTAAVLAEARGAVADQHEAIERRDELIEALSRLPPRQRAVLVMRYFEDLPEGAIAEALGCSAATVRSTASRGLARLREALGSSAAGTHAEPDEQTTARSATQ